MKSNTFSLFNSRLLPASDRGDSGNLSSKTSRNVPPKGYNLPPSGLDDYDRTFRPQVEKISYTRALTGAQFTIELEHLESIESQDVLAWKKKFLDACKIAKWSEEFAADYLEALTSLEIWELIVDQTSVESMLRCLTRRKYPFSKTEFYQQKLSELYQNDYHNIEDYVIAIENVLDRWAVCVNADQRAIQGKKVSVFLQGLAFETLDFMNLHGISGLVDNFNKIKNTKAKIELREKERSYLHSKNNNSTQTPKQRNYREYINKDGYKKYNKPFRYYKDYNNNQHRDEKNKNRGSYMNNKKYPTNYNDKIERPYCRIHKFYGHPTEDCLYNPDSKNYDPEKAAARKNFQRNRLGAIQEPKGSVISINLPVIIEKNNYDCLVDTGASQNYIHPNIVKANDIRTVKTLPAQVRLANNSDISISEKAIVKLKLSETSQIYEEEFMVLKTAVQI